MQLKTISKNISAKLNEWLKTIKDEQLRDRLKDNILVSGGSITSMLLNVPVNDYDIYIKDKCVLLELTEYYTKGHGVTILNGSEKEMLVKNILNSYSNFEKIEDINNAYAIAVRNLKEDQVKLFFSGSKGGLRG